MERKRNMTPIYRGAFGRAYDKWIGRFIPGFGTGLSQAKRRRIERVRHR